MAWLNKIEREKKHLLANDPGLLSSWTSAYNIRTWGSTMFRSGTWWFNNNLTHFENEFWPAYYFNFIKVLHFPHILVISHKRCKNPQIGLNCYGDMHVKEWMKRVIIVSLTLFKWNLIHSHSNRVKFHSKRVKVTLQKS